MSDQGTPQTPDPTPEPHPTAEGATEPHRSRFSRWRDNAWLRERARGIRRGVVVALLAGVLLGAAGGFAVAALTSGGDGHDDRDDHHGRPFEDGDDRDGDGQRGFAPPGSPDQVPPAVPEESSGGTSS